MDNITIRPSASKAKSYDGHFYAVAVVEFGFAARKIRVSPRAFPSRQEAASAAAIACRVDRDKIISLALERVA